MSAESESSGMDDESADGGYDVPADMLVGPGLCDCCFPLPPAIAEQFRALGNAVRDSAGTEPVTVTLHAADKPAVRSTLLGNIDAIRRAAANAQPRRD